MKYSFGNPVALHALTTGGLDDRATTAAIATTTSLFAGDFLTELLRAMTNAKNQQQGNCLDISTSIVRFDADRFVIWAAERIVSDAIGAIVDGADDGSADAKRAGRDAIRRQIGDDATTFIQTIPVNGEMLTRVAQGIVSASERALRRSLEPDDAIQSLVPAVVERVRVLNLAAAEDVLSEHFDAVLAAFARLAEGRIEAGRVSTVAAALQAARAECLTFRIALREVSEGANQRQRIEFALTRANRSVSQVASNTQTADDSTNGYWHVIVNLWKRFRGYSAGQADGDTLASARQDAANACGDYAVGSLEARLAAATIRHVDTTIEAIDELAGRVERFAAKLRAVQDKAETAAVAISATMDAQQKRIRGVLVHANDDLRIALLNTVVSADQSTVADVARSVLTSQGIDLDFDVDEFHEAARANATRLVQPALSWLMNDVVERLPDEGLQALADALADQPSTLVFMKSQAEPTRSVRVAIPGGQQTRLGTLVRRRHSGVLVTESPDASLCFGVGLNTELYAVDLLAGYHEEWFTAFEQIRGRGDREAAQLFSHRALASKSDGVVTDSRIDTLIIKGLVAGVIAPSVGRKPTWYLIPIGESRKPTDVGSSGLRAFVRLGATVPEMRQSLRSKPAGRERVEFAFRMMRDSIPYGQVIAAADAIARGAGLPSPALSDAARELRRELERNRLMEEMTHGVGQSSLAPESTDPEPVRPTSRSRRRWNGNGSLAREDSGVDSIGAVARPISK